MKLKGRKKLFADTLGLGATNILLEGIGLLFQLYLAGILGTEGVGLFELISSVYVLATTFAVSGISMSVTRVVTQAMSLDGTRRINDIMNKAFRISLLLGGFAAVLQFCLAGVFADVLIRAPETKICFQILAIGLPFMSVCSCLSGFFIAERKAVKFASSNIIEDFMKMAIVFIIFSVSPPKNIVIGCTQLVAGLIAGEAGACIISHFMYLADHRRMRTGAEKAHGTARQLMRIGVPVATSSYLRSGLTTLENLLIPIGLQKAGYSAEGALSLFGAMKGLVLPTIFFPAAFLQSFTRVLVPEITDAYTRADTDKIRRAGRRVLRVTLLFSILVGVVIAAFHKGLGQLIFHSEEQGRLLALLAPIAPMMYLDGVVDGILKGMDEQVAVMRYNLYEAAIRCVLVYFILPHTGFWGFIITIYAGNSINAALSLRRLLKKTGIKIGFLSAVVVPAGGAAVCCAVFTVLFGGLPLYAATLLGLLCACAGYVFLFKKRLGS